MKHTRHIDNSIDFTKRLIDIFVEMGGEQAFIEHVATKALQTANSKDPAAERVYKKENKRRISAFGTVETRAKSLLKAMIFVNQKLCAVSSRGGIFSTGWIKTVNDIGVLAKKLHKDLPLKQDHGGQASILRRTFLVSALMSYIRYKNLPFEQRGRSPRNLWIWLSEWNAWLDDNSGERHRTTESSRSIHSWWKQSLNSNNFHVNEAILNGARTYLQWKRELECKKEELSSKQRAPLGKDEANYARIALDELGRKDYPVSILEHPNNLFRDPYFRALMKQIL